MIKRLMRINSQLFVIFRLDLSLTHSCTLGFSWNTLDLEKEGKESGKAQGDNEINNYNQIALRVPSCMYNLLFIFGMHGVCMWLFCYDFSLAQMISWIDNGFSQPCHFLDNHGVVCFFLLLFFSGWFSCSSLLWVELLVFGALVG